MLVAGATESEAIENAKEAIGDYLAVVSELLLHGEQVREINVSVSALPKIPGVNQ